MRAAERAVFVRWGVAGILALALAPACAVVGGGPRDAGSAAFSWPRRHLTVVGGARSLGNAWDPVDDPGVYGAEFDVQVDDDGFGFEFGVLRSRQDSGASEGEITEYYGGVRRSFATRTERFRPHVGGGLALGDYLFDDGTRAKDGSLLGLYLRGGARYALSRHWHVSLDLRLNFLDVTPLSSREQELTGHQLLGGLGFSF